MTGALLLFACGYRQMVLINGGDAANIASGLSQGASYRLSTVAAYYRPKAS